MRRAMSPGVDIAPPQHAHIPYITHGYHAVMVSKLYYVATYLALSMPGIDPMVDVRVSSTIDNKCTAVASFSPWLLGRGKSQAINPSPDVREDLDGKMASLTSSRLRPVKLSTPRPGSIETPYFFSR